MTDFKFKVNIIESERGWGQKIDDIEEFNTYEQAVEFINEYNKDNNKDYVPDWYMYATPNNFIIKQDATSKNQIQSKSN